MKDINLLKRIIEGALFAADKPLSINDILNLFEGRKKPDKQTIRKALDTLVTDCADRGVELKELASGFQYQVKADLAEWIQRLWDEKPARYSRALLETLALIAYRQPITRGEISDVRGVTVIPNITRTLMEREWVHIVGYRDVPGKPALFSTTKKFLDDFGLKSLNDLPPLPEIQALRHAEENLREQLALDDQQVQAQAAVQKITQPIEEIEEVDEEWKEEKEALVSIDELNKMIHEQFAPPKPVETEVEESTEPLTESIDSSVDTEMVEENTVKENIE